MNTTNDFELDAPLSSALDLAPRLRSTELGKCDHFVQFYEEDDFLIDSVAVFIEAGLRADECVIVIATPAHRAALSRRLRRDGVPIVNFIALDASDMLARFMVNGWPNEAFFRDVIGGLVTQTLQRGHGLRAFGEMVTLLWAEGNGKAAIRLEKLWNQLSRSHTFALFCAYPMGGFRSSANAESFLHICHEHTHVLPAESYSSKTAAERLRSISVLQQKAGSLDAEIETRKQAEVHAHAEHSKADTAVAIAGLGLWEMDLVTDALSASDRCKLHFGLKPQETLTINRVLELVHPEDRPMLESLLTQLRNGQSDYNLDCRVIGADGQLRWITAMGRCFHNGSHHMSGVTMDITERKRSSEILEQTVAERTARLQEIIEELEGFSYVMSHDMRSPLRAMHGYARALLDDYGTKLEPMGVSYLQRIQRASQRLDLFIRDVLAYSKIAKGEIELRPIPLGPLITDILDQRPEFLQQRNCITVDHPLPTVLAHEAYLTQCITNLVGNALKFIAPGASPRVRIWSETAGDNVRVWVSDNGIGIHPEHCARIFQIFGRIHPERLYDGTGIGLAIVKKAVTRMGGQAGFQSKPGHGSDFWFNLAAAPHAR